jgi:hypothetical protein
MARSIANDMASLPHWARVAFAARCARQALPLFQRFWPHATPARQASLQTAIRLSEQSAADGRAAEGLNDAVIAAVVTAGAALVPVYGMPDEEPCPADKNACHVASFAAKVAAGRMGSWRAEWGHREFPPRSRNCRRKKTQVDSHAGKWA